MKTITQLFILMMLFTSLSTTKVLADGEIHGRIMNAGKTEPLEFVSVVAMLNEHVMASTTTDENGYYSLKPLTPGSYIVKAVMLGFNTFQVTEVNVNAERVTRLDIDMTASVSSLP